MRKLPIVLTVAAVLRLVATAGARPTAAAGGCSKAALRLVTAGTLTIGTDNPAYPPWFGGGEIKGSGWKINDPSTGQGYESAVAYAVARRLGSPRPG